MTRLVYSSAAKKDLADPWRYINADNPSAADLMLRRIYNKAELLSHHPLLGRARPDLGHHLRSAGVKPYLIFYQPLADGVRMTRIVHGARYLPDLL